MKKLLLISILWILLFSVKTTAQTPAYCASKGVLPWEQWIGNFSISNGNFSHASLKEGYGDFTSLPGATLKRDAGNLIAISPQSSWNADPRNANMFWRVWVDLNGDGDFTDPGEMIVSRQVVISFATFLDNEAAVVLPPTARLGKTRLRVAMKVGGYPDPCETFDRGEVEDYSVEIVDANVTTGKDTLRLVNVTGPNTVRQGAQLTLNVTIKNTGTAASSPNTPLSIYQNQQPVRFPQPICYTLISDKRLINRSIQPNETVMLPIVFTLDSNFTNKDPLVFPPLVHYGGTQITIGERGAPNYCFSLVGPPTPIAVDTLYYSFNIIPQLDVTDLSVQIIAIDSSYGQNGVLSYQYQVKATNQGTVRAKNVVTSFSVPNPLFVPKITPQRGTVSSGFYFGTTLDLWQIGDLEAGESVTASVQVSTNSTTGDVQMVTVYSNQIEDSNPLNNTDSKTFIFKGSYCLSQGLKPWEQWIESVSIASPAGGGNYPPTFKDGYGDFTQLPPVNLARGQGALIVIGPNASWHADPNNANMFWRVWIDWNKNGSFDDPGEMIVSRQVTISNGVFLDNQGSFLVPATATLGKTRLRVAMKVGDYPSSCETFERGEVEDYTVNIMDPNSGVQPLITLGAFKAVVAEGKVRMEWVQKSDNIDVFEIEKSIDGEIFERIARIPASSNLYHVAYDGAPAEGFSFYRLKMYLKNGGTPFSSIQKINYEKMADFAVFPNPASDEAYIDLRKYEDRSVNISISDLAGKIISDKTIEKTTLEPVRLDLNRLENGSYFIIVKSINKRDVVRKIQIIK